MIDIGADLQRAFDEGYEKGKADRPQGDWVIKANGNNECSICGREKQDGWINFCGFCGAKMKGSKK